MDIWVFGTSNKFFISGPKIKAKFSKNKVVTWKTTFFEIFPFCTPYSICLNIGF